MTAYEKIERFYKEGTWTIERVRQAVVKGKITVEQFRLITGENY